MFFVAAEILCSRFSSPKVISQKQAIQKRGLFNIQWGRDIKRYMKKVSKKDKDELRPEYKPSDFPKGLVRGRYAESYPEGVTVALLSPDVARVFPTDEAVNDALRSLIEVAQRSTGLKKRPPRTVRVKKTA